MFNDLFMVDRNLSKVIVNLIFLLEKKISQLHKIYPVSVEEASSITLVSGQGKRPLHVTLDIKRTPVASI